MLKDNLNIRFKKFKDSIINNKYKFGKYWEKEKITFEVDFKDGLFNSKGSRDYLPRIFDESIIDDEIVAVPINQAIKGGQSLDKNLVRVCDIISI